MNKPSPDRHQGLAGTWSKPGSEVGHLPDLDGLRGLAILLVLMHNLSTDVFPATVVGRLLGFVLNFGWVGVQLFFVLSGFLITRILLRTQASSNYYGAFFGRRVLRIFPLYYGSLLVAFVVFPVIGKVSPALAHDQDHQIWLWLYLSNWTHLLNFESQVFPHFWSLAIEEQFYFLWPLVVRYCSSRQVLRLCFALAFASFSIRVAMLWQGAPADSIYTYTVCRMDALALGGAIAAWLQLPRASDHLARHRPYLAWGSLMLLIIGFVVTRGYPRLSALGQTIGYSWLACAFAMAVLAVALRANEAGAVSWKRPLAAEPLLTLGKYSYAMYVFHKPLHDWIGRPLLVHFKLLDQPSCWVAVGYFVIGTLTTLALAATSFHLFEKRFIALKRLFVAETALGVTPQLR